MTLRAMTDDASKVAFSEAQYQPAVIITILIFGLLIDKNSVVPQLLR